MDLRTHYEGAEQDWKALGAAFIAAGRQQIVDAQQCGEFDVKDAHELLDMIAGNIDEVADLMAKAAKAHRVLRAA